MLCDVCNENDVVITLTEIDGDGVRQVRLCEKCAAERGVQAAVVAPKPDLGTFVHSMHQQVNPLQGDAVRCTFCGATLGRGRCPRIMGRTYSAATARAAERASMSAARVARRAGAHLASIRRRLRSTK